MSHRTLAQRPNAASSLAAPSLASTRSGGQALDRPLQTRMSARFGHDFSQVRIHTDSRAAESAHGVGAHAFAQGADIVFGAGRYQPGSPDTERLLAHELTHVVQQAQWGPGDPHRLSNRGDASEREADALASQVMVGRSVQVGAAPGAAVARDQTDGTAAPAAAPEDHSTRDYLINMAATAGGFLPGPLGLAATAAGGAESIRQMPGQNDPDKGIKTAEGVAGFVNSAVGMAASMAGFDGAAAVAGGAAAGGGTGAAALGPASLVAGAGLAGLATGHYLAENTEVGQNTVDVLGGVDKAITGEGQRSAMLRLDEYRQDQWDKGGVGGVAKSIGAGVGEAGLGLVGALGGLGGGLVHGAQWLGGQMAHNDADGIN